MEEMKKLVVYYSLEGNVKFVAEKIAEAAGADLLQLKPRKDLNPDSFMKYFWGGKQVIFKEKPELLPMEKNPADYDVLYIGTPVWAGSFAPALNTFFSQVNLTGKKIALFCCYGSHAGKTFVNLKKKLEGNSIIGEMGFKEPLKHDKHQEGEKAKKWAREVI